MFFVNGVNSLGNPYTVHFYQRNGGLLGEITPPHSLPSEELEKVVRDWGNAHPRLFDQLPDYDTAQIQKTIDASLREFREDLSTIAAGVYERRQEADNLTQFLGVSLRGVLPYAIESVAQRRYQAQITEDPEAAASAALAHRQIDRAEAALAALRESDLNVDALNDDELDDGFTILFEE